MRIAVVASGDFLLPDGSPAFPEFDFRAVAEHPRVDFSFLAPAPAPTPPPTPPIAPGQVAGADIVILSAPRVSAEKLPSHRTPATRRFVDARRLAPASVVNPDVLGRPDWRAKAGRLAGRE